MKWDLRSTTPTTGHRSRNEPKFGAVANHGFTLLRRLDSITSGLVSRFDSVYLNLKIGTPLDFK